jgi:hypothetical protein
MWNERFIRFHRGEGHGSTESRPTVIEEVVWDRINRINRIEGNRLSANSANLREPGRTCASFSHSR